jgi:hypothetical protein
VVHLAVHGNGEMLQFLFLAPLRTESRFTVVPALPLSAMSKSAKQLSDGVMRHLLHWE